MRSLPGLLRGSEVKGELQSNATPQEDATRDRAQPAGWVGSHGHGAIHDLLVGSTTKGIIRLATCPILLVPPHATEAGRQPEAIPDSGTVKP